MCLSVEVSGLFTIEGLRQLIQYPDADAALPIQDPARGILWLPWGRRREESGNLPVTGWLVDAESLPEGWERFSPTPVRARVCRFMEVTEDGEERWFKAESLQCLLLRHGDEQRVYVVTARDCGSRYRSRTATRALAECGGFGALS
ncbi:hypothetical protein ACUTAH_26345 [Metapseudomonas furukawaii]|uniref:hypothetical protein n=1 Tax=Metapseudomonas furukawaii TaxID=1149133 RepID=UPI00227CCF79|nr:hypothetical protein [Pseudomonas furukawaii]WAG76632.1 hypothetical protein LMK08_14685 [Pseudomonas furukawaii]